MDRNRLDRRRAAPILFATLVVTISAMFALRFTTVDINGVSVPAAVLVFVAMGLIDVLLLRLFAMKSD